MNFFFQVRGDLSISDFFNYQISMARDVGVDQIVIEIEEEETTSSSSSSKLSPELVTIEGTPVETSFLGEIPDSGESLQSFDVQSEDISPTLEDKRKRFVLFLFLFFCFLIFLF